VACLVAGEWYAAAGAAVQRTCLLFCWQCWHVDIQVRPATFSAATKYVYDPFHPLLLPCREEGGLGVAQLDADLHGCLSAGGLLLQRAGGDSPA
jgi:hypothetical protein